VESFIGNSNLRFEIWNCSVFGVFDAEAAEGIREVFEGVMELVADVADAESGALADLVVFEAFVIFEGDELALVFVEF